MTMTITVYPTKASALKITHPGGLKLGIAGSAWPKDGFTSRMLTDGILTTDPAKAYKAPPDPLHASPGLASSANTKPAATTSSGAGGPKW